MNKYRNILFESPRPFIIIQLENDKYNPSIGLAYQIAKFFGTSIEEVFIFEEDK